MLANTRPARTIPVRIVLVAGTDAADEPRISAHLVPGWLVAPGLVVHRTWDHGEPAPEGLYSLTHLASGGALTTRRCAVHVDQAVADAVATGIDWTAHRDEIRTNPRYTPLQAGDDWCQDGVCAVESYPRPDSPVSATAGRRS